LQLVREEFPPSDSIHEDFRLDQSQHTRFSAAIRADLQARAQTVRNPYDIWHSERLDLAV
jgi:hypothetical protein